MLPIEKLISKTLNLKTAGNSKAIEELIKSRELPPDPKLEKIAAEAEKILKSFKSGE